MGCESLQQNNLPAVRSSATLKVRLERYLIKPQPIASWYNPGVDTNERPEKPQHLPEYAILCLEALSRSGLSDRLSLGGAIGLMHYYEYRTTHDVDAWWIRSISQRKRQEVVSVLEKTLAPFGDVRTRQWGDVVSIELRQEGKAVFSFQIAERSVLLEPPQPSPWPGVLLDRLPDLIASKMTALVERGAPRDFVDIYNLCRENIVTAHRCWELWELRQAAAEGEANRDRASLAVQLHLERIESHRPLAQIDEVIARESAESLRRWYRKEFLNAAIK